MDMDLLPMSAMPAALLYDSDNDNEDRHEVNSHVHSDVSDHDNASFNNGYKTPHTVQHSPLPVTISSDSISGSSKSSRRKKLQPIKCPSAIVDDRISHDLTLMAIVPLY
jgi:hypothetical protein